MTRDEVLLAIANERAYGIAKWGKRTLSVQAWLLVIEEELNEAKRDWVKTESDDAALQELVQVAACCIACLEQHGAVPRAELMPPRYWGKSDPKTCLHPPGLRIPADPADPGKGTICQDCGSRF